MEDRANRSLLNRRSLLKLGGVLDAPPPNLDQKVYAPEVMRQAAP